MRIFFHSLVENILQIFYILEKNHLNLLIKIFIYRKNAIKILIKSEINLEEVYAKSSILFFRTRHNILHTQIRYMHLSKTRVYLG